MVRPFLWVVLGALLLSGAPGARGSETDAPLGAWESAVQTLSRALAERDPSAVIEVVPGGAVVQTLDANPVEVIRLMARTAKGVPVFARGYVGVPLTLAQDISKELAGKTELPEIAVRQMTISEASARPADATAAKWVSDVLQPKEGERIGVIVIWCQHPATAATEAGNEAIFVLLKGDVTAERGARIRLVAFGNPFSGR